MIFRFSTSDKAIPNAMWAPVPGFPCIHANTKHWLSCGKPNPRMNKHFNPAFLGLCLYPYLFAIGMVGKDKTWWKHMRPCWFSSLAICLAPAQQCCRQVWSQCPVVSTRQGAYWARIPNRQETGNSCIVFKQIQPWPGLSLNGSLTPWKPQKKHFRSSKWVIYGRLWHGSDK